MIEKQRRLQTWDIEVRMTEEDKWSLGARCFNQATAEKRLAEYQSRIGLVNGECVYYPHVRLVEPG